MSTLKSIKLDLCSIMLLLVIGSTVLLSQIPGGNKINFALTVLFVVITFLVAMIENRPFRLFPPFVILAVWLCSAIISSLMATNLELALERVIQMIQILVLVSVATNVLVWSGRSEVFALVYAAAAVLSYVGSLAGFGFGVIDSSLVVAENVGVRAAGLTTNANAFGTLMVQGQLAAILVGVQVKKRYARYLILFAFLFLGMAVIHSGSRTALVGMIVLIIGCGWIFRIWRIKNAAKALAMLMVASVLASVAYVSLKNDAAVQGRVESFLSDESIISRYENLLKLVLSGGDIEETDITVEGSILSRAQYANYAWNAAVSKAPFGLGLGNFSVIYGGYAHSNYFEILATTGFLGLLIFLVMYISMYIYVFRIRRESRNNPLLIRAYIASLAVLMIMDIAAVTYYSKPFWIFVAMAIGTIEVYRDTRVTGDRPQIR